MPLSSPAMLIEVHVRACNTKARLIHLRQFGVNCQHSFSRLARTSQLQLIPIADYMSFRRRCLILPRVSFVVIPWV